MTKQEIISQLHILKVTPSMSVPVDDLASKWADRSGKLVVGAFQILGAIRQKIPNVELRTRCSGVSGYGHAHADGRFRECFHVGVNVRPSAMIFCQHGGAPDPKHFFGKVPPNGRYVYGYLHESDSSQLPYVIGVLTQSYQNIIGH